MSAVEKIHRGIQLRLRRIFEQSVERDRRRRLPRRDDDVAPPVKIAEQNIVSARPRAARHKPRDADSARRRLGEGDREDRVVVRGGNGRGRDLEASDWRCRREMAGQKEESEAASSSCDNPKTRAVQI